MPREPYAGLATTFSTVAELYERVRPGYPQRLFADLAVVAGPAASMLEIGAGTRQATRLPPGGRAAAPRRPPGDRRHRASGFFAPPVVHRYVWGQDYTAEEYLALVSSYPGTSPPPPSSGRRCSPGSAP